MVVSLPLAALGVLLAQDGGSPIDGSAIAVAIVSVMGTLGAAWLMFRGKTQDTANWLIVELRNEARDAREAAKKCETHRIEDRLKIEDLRSSLAVVEAGLRHVTAEKDGLKRRLDQHLEHCAIEEGVLYDKDR